MKFHIKTPNPKYKGITLGVKFNDGLGFTDDELLKNVLVFEYGYEDVTPDDKKNAPKGTNKSPDNKEK
jgi:hypothetical protein